jgi:hypothetical protein
LTILPFIIPIKKNEIAENIVESINALFEEMILIPIIWIIMKGLNGINPRRLNAIKVVKAVSFGSFLSSTSHSSSLIMVSIQTFLFDIIN